MGYHFDEYSEHHGDHSWRYVNPNGDALFIHKELTEGYGVTFYLKKVGTSCTLWLLLKSVPEFNVYRTANKIVGELQFLQQEFAEFSRDEARLRSWKS